MATWTVSTTEKKQAYDNEIWTRDGKTITVVNGFRWATFTVTTTDDNPPEDLDPSNPDGVDMYSFGADNVEDVELDSMDDGWYGDIEYSDNITDSQREEIQAGIDEEGAYEYLEAQGWRNDENQAMLYGPLDIVRAD